MCFFKYFCLLVMGVLVCTLAYATSIELDPLFSTQNVFANGYQQLPFEIIVTSGGARLHMPVSQMWFHYEVTNQNDGVVSSGSVQGGASAGLIQVSAEANNTRLGGKQNWKFGFDTVDNIFSSGVEAAYLSVGSGALNNAGKDLTITGVSLGSSSGVYDDGNNLNEITLHAETQYDSSVNNEEVTLLNGGVTTYSPETAAKSNAAHIAYQYTSTFSPSWQYSSGYLPTATTDFQIRPWIISMAADNVQSVDPSASARIAMPTLQVAYGGKSYVLSKLPNNGEELTSGTVSIGDAGRVVPNNTPNQMLPWFNNTLSLVRQTSLSGLSAVDPSRFALQFVMQSHPFDRNDHGINFYSPPFEEWVLRKPSQSGGQPQKVPPVFSNDVRVKFNNAKPQWGWQKQYYGVSPYLSTYITEQYVPKVTSGASTPALWKLSSAFTQPIPVQLVGRDIYGNTFTLTNYFQPLAGAYGVFEAGFLSPLTFSKPSPIGYRPGSTTNFPF